MHVTEADDRDRPSDSDVDIIDLEWVDDAASMAGLVRVDIRRAEAATRFLTVVSRIGEPPIVVFDYDLPLSRGAFEFRSSGVWTELVCEAPLDHWTIGLEAFGLVVSADEVVTPETYGDRVPVGLDLDLDTIGAPLGDSSSFEIPVRVHGEVLLADGAHEIDGTGIRRRGTDGRRPSSLVADAPPRLGEVTVAWPLADGVPHLERRGWFGGSRAGWTALDYSG